MVDKVAIEAFLRDFHAKQAVFGIIFRGRPKNTQALLRLEISAAQQAEIIRSLEAKDYCEGPLEEKLYGGADMWVFGKKVKGTEIYIKVTLGIISRSVICISFHEAEHPLSYPLKNTI